MSNLSANNTKSLILMGVLIAFMVWGGHSLAGQLGAQIAFFTSIALMISAYWYSDKLVLSLYRAVEINQDDKPQLYATVAYLAENAKVPRPRIYLIDENMPNIFSVGRNAQHGAIAVTKGLLAILNKDELAGAVAHELAHIKLNDTFLATLAASVGGFITLLANWAQAIFVFGLGSRNKGNNKLAVMLMSMLAPMIAIIIQIFISREREFYADEKAAEFCENPAFVANALRKIELARDKHQLQEVEQNPSTAHLFAVSPLRARKWQILFASHPPIVERIERLECMILD
ncbi:MAG: M48 family metalloprotease [Candidatus Berkiella sp.]